VRARAGTVLERSGCGSRSILRLSDSMVLGEHKVLRYSAAWKEKVLQRTSGLERGGGIDASGYMILIASPLLSPSDDLPLD